MDGIPGVIDKRNFIRDEVYNGEHAEQNDAPVLHDEREIRIHFEQMKPAVSNCKRKQWKVSIDARCKCETEGSANCTDRTNIHMFTSYRERGPRLLRARMNTLFNTQRADKAIQANGIKSG